MSLINKMLQDLDARGTPAPGPMQVHVKPVDRHERRVSLPLVAAAVAGAVLIAAAGAFGWRYLHKPAASFPPPRPPAVAMRAPAPPQPAPAAPIQPVAPSATSVQPAPAASVPEEPAAKAAVAAQPGAEIASAPADAVEASPAEHKKTRKERREEQARLAAEKKEKAAHARKERLHAQAESKKDGASAKKDKHGAATPKEEATASPKKSRRAAAEGREETPAQRAEGAYRRALGSLQDGRVSEAIPALQQALQIEPKHDAARQTLVGLLIEAKRNDEAMRQLQVGLTLDPRQPALAMLLARLQIERGETGIETLARTLPYAAGNGDYQALLAGALQRQQRHREAAEQYQAALRTQPQNAVWWMGLGISLQAEKRTAEALDAFKKAKAAGTLSPELQSFVERKIGQLGR
jgi:MSHA biogenesis protein MshN